MTSRERAPQWWRVTGGSTAQPIQLPAWHSEKAVVGPDQWLGRHWFGVRPSDRLFWLWGHSHLLGSGLGGQINRRVRGLKDWLLGYYRYSAYDLCADSMVRAGDILLSFGPDYVIGYSVALDSFARINRDRAGRFHDLGLKVVIACAESFPSADSAQTVSDVLGAPLAMEYGSIETGVVAYTTPLGGYQTFWRNHFVEAQDSSVRGGRVVRVTSLYPRCFPLVRYELGDEIELGCECDTAGRGVSKFKRVIGRCNDYVAFADGTRIHSEAFAHAIRDCADIAGYQTVQDGSNIRIKLISGSRISAKTIKAIRSRLRIVHPALADVVVEQVEVLEQTVAGKTPVVIRRSCTPERTR